MRNVPQGYLIFNIPLSPKKVLLLKVFLVKKKNSGKAISIGNLDKF